MIEDYLRSIGWHIQEHMYCDPDTNIRMAFFAIHDGDGKDTGAYGDTPEQAWLGAIMVAMTQQIVPSSLDD